MTSAPEIARWRLHSQRLVEPHASTATAVVEGLLAVQAENAAQAAWAVACRTGAPDPADLAALLDDGRVIRTHVLRPTWHFVSAADVGWLLELTAPRVLPVITKQLAGVHGWSDAAVDRARSAVVESLTERPHQTRDQVAKSLGERGVEATGQPLVLLLALLELDRQVCSGRPLDGAHTYALFADRVPGGRRPDREEALAELALRYFTGHGPATERDLAYWATLTLGDVRRGIDTVRDRLGSFQHDGRTFWHARDAQPPQADQHPRGHLLQILDETYRGYQDSRMVLDAAGVVPRGRETALGMALVDGQMVARMKRTLGSSRVVFELEPFRGRLSAEQLRALEPAAAAYGDFLGLPHELVVRG